MLKGCQAIVGQRAPRALAQGHLGAPGDLREAAKGGQNENLKPKRNNIKNQYKMLKVTTKVSG